MTAADGVVELTRELLAIDTINPPGHEARAAAIVGRRLAGRGPRM